MGQICEKLQWAVICEHIIRPYSEGWADGLKMGIKYWEIWGEPDLDLRPLPWGACVGECKHGAQFGTRWHGVSLFVMAGHDKIAVSQRGR